MQQHLESGGKHEIQNLYAIAGNYRCSHSNFHTGAITRQCVHRAKQPLARVVGRPVHSSVIRRYLSKTPFEIFDNSCGRALGFTGIGWLVALIWSFGSTKQTVVVVNQPPMAATPQNASTPLPVANKTIAERIAELKAMLDSGTISQSEFELLKADAVKGLA